MVKNNTQVLPALRSCHGPRDSLYGHFGHVGIFGEQWLLDLKRSELQECGCGFIAAFHFLFPFGDGPLDSFWERVVETSNYRSGIFGIVTR